MISQVAQRKLYRKLMQIIKTNTVSSSGSWTIRLGGLSLNDIPGLYSYTAQQLNDNHGLSIYSAEILSQWIIQSWTGGFSCSGAYVWVFTWYSL